MLPILKIGKLVKSESHLVALLSLVVAVGVREVDVTARVLHHLLDIVSPFADDM